jgi:nucleoside-diphosphate-sugar epimerase
LSLRTGGKPTIDPMDVLFIGGTGIISSACARAALARGMGVTFLCRGKTERHPVPPGVTLLRGDIRDLASARAALGDRRFDAVVQWVGFLPAHVLLDIELFDGSLLPVHGGWTIVDRMRRGLPVIVHGDGSSLWTLTHNDDFARGFVRLLGQAAAIGEAFHITSDETPTWDQIHRILGRAAGVTPHLVHVPSELIAAYDPEWGASLLGDKTHSMVFDNAKIKKMVPEFRTVIPYARAAKEQIAWYDADDRRRVVDGRLNATIDRIVAGYGRAWPAEATSPVGPLG